MATFINAQIGFGVFFTADTQEMSEHTVLCSGVTLLVQGGWVIRSTVVPSNLTRSGALFLLSSCIWGDSFYSEKLSMSYLLVCICW